MSINYVKTTTDFSSNNNTILNHTFGYTLTLLQINMHMHTRPYFYLSSPDLYSLHANTQARTHTNACVDNERRRYVAFHEVRV